MDCSIEATALLVWKDWFLLISAFQIVALFAAFWASLHTIGHCVNFYHVATQSQEGLHCLFQEAVFGLVSHM